MGKSSMKPVYHYTKAEFEKELNRIASPGLIRAGKGNVLHGTIAYKLADSNYDSAINEKAVISAMILERGRNFGDGFSGLKVKKASYNASFAFELVDGERGQVFFRVYDHFPQKDEFLEDVAFDLHRSCVAIAILEGKKVKAEVLAEYPEMLSLEIINKIAEYQKRLEK